MLRCVVKKFAYFATLLTIVANIYIYTYPSFHPEQCSWNCSDKNTTLREDSTLLEKVKGYFNDVQEQWYSSHASDSDDIHIMAFGDPQIKGNWPKTPYVSRLDTYGNDYYLGHIYDMMQQRLKPQVVTVMGDLFSSQWIGDSEFHNRTQRYISRIFKRDPAFIERVKTENLDEDGQYKANWSKWGDRFNEILSTAQQNDTANEDLTFGFEYENIQSWNPDLEDFLFINITGNHDVGYSGDATYQHMTRFYDLFGKDNYWIEYETNTTHPWRIVVLNDLLLEGPALQPEFVDATWMFLKQLSERKFAGSTVLLTHVPFYKREGLCYDGPDTRYYPDVDAPESYKTGLLRSQNHLGESVSNEVLNMIFENGKPGIILTGHDHEGCETVYNKKSSATWEATKDIESDIFVKEITVKSMMGEFNGNTGLVTGHFNTDTMTWDWTFSLCPFAIQHVWWFAKVSLLVAIFTWSSLLFV
ncbi:hypothetical protein SEUBUCD646_0I01330 [Saccharomyces eubayanus]|uniref:TED1-like protein n=1 Tax=Saccharomyces eubayanus TaxID=1080349 RepID=A0ABN8VV28_SACEU|nr:hypothetical protein SEUBUCD650_0I01330 [Saccharomyces eubayanus]CAI2050399.1 hypothetical protein SEUBUCD646_0I01330 [Saccharomyces eubayanus]